jgi:hypothetical protein
MVAIDSQLFTDRDYPFAVFWEVDSDRRKTFVHRPLHFGSGATHFRLGAIERRFEVEPFRTLRHAPRSQSPSGAGGHSVIRCHPLLAKRHLVGVFLDDIGAQPVCHMHKGNRPHYSIH